MDAETTWLRDRVVEFLGVLQDCLGETNYTQDRVAFTQDVVAAASWIVDLHRGRSADSVKAEILAPQTDKTFGDYYRQGEWGRRSSDALQALRDAVRLRNM